VLERRRVRRGGDGLKRNRCTIITFKGNSYSSVLTFITAYFAKVLYLCVLNVIYVVPLS
jgi:hypothetical protein